MILIHIERIWVEQHIDTEASMAKKICLTSGILGRERIEADLTSL